MSKKILFFSSMILLIATMTTLLMLVVTKKIYITSHISQSDNPDFFMTNVRLTQLNKEGKIHNQIFTTKLLHYPDKDTYIFEKPEMKSFTINDSYWVLTADSGKSEFSSKKIYLWDNVKIFQKKKTNNIKFDISTSKVEIIPKDKIAKTNEPIVIKQADSIVKAIGAQIDLKNNKIKLLSDIEGEYRFMD